MSTEIFVVTHKETQMPEEPCYTPLFVGAAGRPVPEGYRRDDTGDNISAKNDSYCELTGGYWLWMNTDAGITGLVHYRRFFAHVRGFEYKSKHIVLSKKNAYRILSAAEAEKILAGCDILVKKSRTYKETNETLFYRDFGAEIMDEARAVVQSQYPEYSSGFDRNLNMHYHVNCNMFIGHKEIADRYYDWLFDVLGRVDEAHKNRTGDRFHNRELGYLGEILFGVWLDHNRINYRFYPVVCTSELDYTHPGRAEGCLVYPHELIRLKFSRAKNG